MEEPISFSHPKISEETSTLHHWQIKILLREWDFAQSARTKHSILLQSRPLTNAVGNTFPYLFWDTSPALPQGRTVFDALGPASPLCCPVPNLKKCLSTVFWSSSTQFAHWVSHTVATHMSTSKLSGVLWGRSLLWHNLEWCYWFPMLCKTCSTDLYCSELTCI